MQFNEDWTADVVGRMHKYKIKNIELAKECNYSDAYLSTVLNGNKDLTEKAKEETKNRILDALDRLIAQREEAKGDA